MIDSTMVPCISADLKWGVAFIKICQPAVPRANIGTICRKLACHKIRESHLGHFWENEEDEDDYQKPRCTVHPPLPALDKWFDLFLIVFPRLSALYFSTSLKLGSIDSVCYGEDKIYSFNERVPAKEFAVQQKLREWMFASVCMFVQSGRKQEQYSNIMYRGPPDMSQHLTNDNLKYWECKKTHEINQQWVLTLQSNSVNSSLLTQDMQKTWLFRRLLMRNLSLVNLEIACLLRSPARPPLGVEN